MEFGSQVETTKISSLDHSGMDLDVIVDELEFNSPRSNEYFKSIAVSRPHKEILSLAWDVELVAYALPIVTEDILDTYKDAIQTPQSEDWKLEI